MALAKDMVDQVRALLRPLQTRLVNSIARAVVQLVDDGKKQQLLQLGVLEGEDIDDAEHFHPYGFSSVPLAGAEAVVVFPGGDRGHPLVVAVSDRRYRPTGGQAGDVLVYNQAATKILLRGGVVMLGADGLLATEGVLNGTAIDPFTGATHAALGNASAVVRAKK